LSIRLLNTSDIPAAMRLKEAAGWNQTEDDWRRLLVLAPDSCFCVEYNGHMAATTTAVVYGGKLAWIGMVLTAPEFRKRGFAHMLMRHTLDYLRKREIEWAKLDATEMGARVYSDFGFQLEYWVERWQRAATAPSAVGEDCSSREIDPQAMTNRDAFGVSREPLLESLIREGSAAVNGLGFALWRPGSFAHYFGPCVATSFGEAEELLRHCLRAKPGLPFVWDLATENAAAVQLAKKYDFQKARTLSRMACALRPRAKPMRPDMNSIFALAGFEFG
jgi:GNAT superfamily N-acetyltransferase